MAEEMPHQDFAEGVPEVLNAVSVDDRVDHGVGVRQNDGHVHDNRRLLQIAVKQREAVEDVDGQPADGEKSHDDGEGFSGPDLLLQQPLVLVVPVAHTLELNLPQLLPGHGEDLHVDAQHYEQGHQHAHKEVKVHHILHVHHALKVTLFAVCAVDRAAVLPTRVLQVPPKEGNEADDKGEDP